MAISKKGYDSDRMESRLYFTSFLLLLPSGCLLTKLLFQPKLRLFLSLSGNNLAALAIFGTEYFTWHVIHYKVRVLKRYIHSVHHQYHCYNVWVSQYRSASLGITFHRIFHQNCPSFDWCASINIDMVKFSDIENFRLVTCG